MNKQLVKAIAYVRMHNVGTSGNTIDDIINDAANIYGRSYEEYCSICSQLDDIFDNR